MVWRDMEEPEIPRLGPLQWLVFSLRLVVMLIGTLIIIPTYILFKVLEKPFRPIITPILANLWGRLGLFLCGIKLEVVGKHMRHGGAVVANHVTWVDIFTLNSAARISFVAKAEVRNWPVIGFLARVSGTLFIERRSTHAKRHEQALLERLDRGDQLCFFPEGTSTDGRRVIPFKSTLFSVFHTAELIEHTWVQPATLSYIAPVGKPADFYGWWGDMAFAPHVAMILGQSFGGKVRVTLHDPVRASDFDTRKALAQYCETVVRAGLEKDLL